MISAGVAIVLVAILVGFVYWLVDAPGGYAVGMLAPWVGAAVAILYIEHRSEV